MGSEARSRNVLRASRWRRSHRNGGACTHEGLDRGRSPQKFGRRRGHRRSHRRAPRACRLPAEPRRLEGPRTLGETVLRASLGGRERRRPRGRYLAVRLAGSGDSVVDVPPKLSARVRVVSSFAGNARKNDGVDALATALVASRNGRLVAVDPEVGSEALRLLSERREDLVAERTRERNRLHGLLRDL